MLRETALALAVLTSACAPAPTHMPASEASELLERFAAGSAASDVCTPEGRALLRGAVRAYGAELARAGVVWPAVGNGAALHSVDVAVLSALAAGFVEASDFRGAPPNLDGQLTFVQWPQIRDMRLARQVACAQVVELQRAALRMASEMDRYQRAAARDEPERLRRQQERLERAQAQMRAIAAMVEEEVAEARRRS